ncbi:uncharacterized protein LOC143050847 [Mytilus galloprovincialis]|uniref:uncharacterized protein LOC143050847 n=1 Tax=Mytilus galloprovincialis TaxID=29158 RepID=UPI003F7B99D9
MSITTVTAEFNLQLERLSISAISILSKNGKNLCKPVTANRTTSNNHTISETIHNTYIAQVDTAVSHEQIPLHALQPISSETTFPRENEDIVEVKNKKRRKRKRKQEVYGRLNKEILYSSPSLKTSLTSQKGMTIEVRNKKRTNKKCKPEGNGRSKQESEIDVSNLAPSLKTSLTSQKGMIIGVKNKKRTNKKRKPEGNGRSNMESEIDVSNLAPRYAFVYF